MDDTTGLVSLGSAEPNHIQLTGIAGEQAYLYVSEGQMVVEDAVAGSGGVTVDGYAVEEPSFVGPMSFIQVGPYTIKVHEAGTAPAAAPAGALHEASTAPGVHDADTAHGAGEPREEPTDLHDAGTFIPPVGEPAEPAPEGSADGYYHGGAAEVALDVAYGPGGPAIMRGPLKITALVGMMAGKEFVLKRGSEYDVGRDEILEVYLDDPTVSRRHARLRADEGSVVVMDLRSTNGTFINGEKVKRKVALPGDRVRFGEVGFKLELAVPLAADEAKAKKKKIPPQKLVKLVAAGVAVIAVVVLGVGLVQRLSKKKKKRGPAVPQETLTQKQRRRFSERLTRGEQHMKKQEWRQALQAFEAALEDYPSVTARQKAKDAVTAARAEIQAEKDLRDGKTHFDAGGSLENFLKAKTHFRKIPPGSYYSAAARDKLEEVNLRIAGIYALEGKTFYRGRRMESKFKAHRLLCRYFLVIGEIPKPILRATKLRADLRKLERKLRKKKKFVPCKAQRFLKPYTAVATTTPGVDGAALLMKKYQVKQMVDVLLLYQKGEMDQALSKLMKLRDKKKMAPYLQLISDVQKKIALVKGKIGEGYSALEAKDTAKADRALAEASRWEKKLLPTPLKSYHLKEATKRLGEQFFKLGEQQFALGRYRKAFRHWSRGRFYNPSHTGILNGMVKLEKEALRVFQQAQSYGPSRSAQAAPLYQKVLEMTEPKSPLHKQAFAALKQSGR
jgi:pSer/pThr/pTyr-binding forkhead associated (FHA) protein